MPELRVPQKQLTVEQMASELLTQAKGDARQVDTFCWARADEAAQRNSAPANEFWRTVSACITERTEEPPVPRKAYPRFDAAGKVTTEPAP